MGVAEPPPWHMGVARPPPWPKIKKKKKINKLEGLALGVTKPPQRATRWGGVSVTPRSADLFYNIFQLLW
jgi:hypothetical protein